MSLIQRLPTRGAGSLFHRSDSFTQDYAKYARSGYEISGDIFFSCAHMISQIRRGLIEDRFGRGNFPLPVHHDLDMPVSDAALCRTTILVVATRETFIVEIFVPIMESFMTFTEITFGLLSTD